MTEIDPTDPLIGRTLLDKLRVVRRIGAGGMGAVYEVEHLATGHRRALKVLHASLQGSPEVMARFAREARVSATLRSPFVVETYDAGMLEDGTAYVLMELLEGRSLSSVLKDEGALSASRVIRLVAQLCEGLTAAHAAGIVHRDLKPDNVFLVAGTNGEEQVKILDFGISKFRRPDAITEQMGALTADGQMLGTPFYMSPEQANANVDIDARTDIYALGVMLYEALAGRRPFEASAFTALVLKIHQGDCTPLGEAAPHLDRNLAGAVMRAMHRDRDQRFTTTADLRDALLGSEPRSSWVVDLDAPLTTTKRFVHETRSSGRWRVIAVALGSLTLLAGVVGIGMWLGASPDVVLVPPPSEPEPAVRAPPSETPATPWVGSPSEPLVEPDAASAAAVPRDAGSAHPVEARGLRDPSVIRVRGPSSGPAPNGPAGAVRGGGPGKRPPVDRGDPYRDNP